MTITREQIDELTRLANEAADGDYDPDAVIAWLARHGFAIVRNPEHAPKAVEAADLTFWGEYGMVPVVPDKKAMGVAITTYIEHARK